MSNNSTIISETIDLTNCDREPIHIPGSIQPHGFLLILQEPELKIIQVSENTAEFIGKQPETLLNTYLEELLIPKEIDAIKKCLESDFENVNPLKLTLKKRNKFITFDGIIHRFDGVLFLELEPAKTKINPDFFGFYHLVRNTISKLQNTSKLSEMCNVIVKEVQKITQFDRVMVYQFDATGAGTVIAEAKREDCTPFLGLRYPPSDIPKQAKQLYTDNWLRLIPNANYQPVPLIPQLNPITNSPTNLSFAVLRSVSPIHIQYLHNMGVGASMSISLIKNKKLWGLIACHHESTKYLSYEIRTACEFLGQVVSWELIAKEENEDLDYKMQLKSILTRFMESIPQNNDFVDSLIQSEVDLLALTSAQGVAICQDNQWRSIGQTPENTDLETLLEWIETKIEGNLFHTDALSQEYPEAEKYQQIVSGVIALAISKVNRNYILWFRPEVIQTVNWGGNPNKPVEVKEDDILYLSPRKSFTLWQETVKGKSLAWKPCEIEAVLELRSAIVGIVLRRADELAKINLELERSNNELDAFAYIASHDLKEPLRGIHNYATFLIEDYANVLHEEGISKLETLVRLTQRMEDLIDSLLHFSRLGRVELAWQETDLNDIVKNVIDVLNLSSPMSNVEIRIPRPLPIVRCDRIQINEVFSNLLSNAIKYNDRTEKWIEIGFLDLENQPRHDAENSLEATTILYVRDNGIGIRDYHLENIFRIFKRLHGPKKYGGGTGAGLTIAKKIVERHGGTIWVESIFGEGSTFYFTLPR
ncbi:GAF domain-containing protein [Phormidium sp. LEGE 05292]|uniref:ATP-binding protein n=1 Tax=[Phormidium] sp. LEGE 05292 TaxID=767427 RepID=UPI0018819B66|nr:ATP-binding protein [Phormidium sp. LEGE 05292]MBE9228627.1 GAF domain-containing protein [Phormidium sp. LEGE 05292]